MIDTDTPTTTAAPVPTADRPQVRFWERVIRDFPDLKRSEVAVIDAFTQFPHRSAADLATIAQVSASTAANVIGSDRFSAILAAYMAARGDLFAHRNRLILEKLQTNLAEKAFSRTGWTPTGDERAILELSLKAAGQLSPDALAIHNHGPTQINVTAAAEMQARLGRVSQAARVATGDNKAENTST